MFNQLNKRESNESNKKKELAIVKRGEFEYNFIDKQGKLLSNEWFRCIDYFKDGLARV